MAVSVLIRDQAAIFLSGRWRFSHLGHEHLKAGCVGPLLDCWLAPSTFVNLAVVRDAGCGGWLYPDYPPCHQAVGNTVKTRREMPDCEIHSGNEMGEYRRKWKRWNGKC